MAAAALGAVFAPKTSKCEDNGGWNPKVGEERSAYVSDIGFLSQRPMPFSTQHHTADQSPNYRESIYKKVRYPSAVWDPDLRVASCGTVNTRPSCSGTHP
jgi:hypothetical protein